MKTLRPPTAAQVARLREQSKLTAAAFGELVYVEAPTVYAWESGRRQCPTSTWELLLIYFGRIEPRRQPEAVS